MKLRAGSDPCASAEDFALFNLAEDPYEEHPYLYGTGNMTSDHAYKWKCQELVGRLRELSVEKYQTGVTEAYVVQPDEVLYGPLAAACSVARVQAPGRTHILE